MTASELSLDLTDALRALRGTVRAFAQEAEQPLAHREAPLRHLEEVIRSLGQAKSPKPPPRSEEYEQQWRDLLNGIRQQLGRRAVRYLCWEPDVAIDGRFQSYLDREYMDLSHRWLQGLVRSCHAHWSVDFVIGPVINKVRSRLENYQGTNRLLIRWKEVSGMILGPRGHQELASYMIENLETINACCDELGVDEQTRYVLEAVHQAVRHCFEGIGRSRIFSEYLLDELLPWSKWPLQDFKAEVGATILHPEVAEISEPLTNFILRDTRLGDPRLPKNARNWIGLPDEARLRFIQWLSRADIAFFFEHVLPDRIDRHGRKAFWLQYLPRLRMSRPLLNRKDEYRLQTVMRQMQEQVRHFGRAAGQTSAFLLDFGPIQVIEFSEVGACHIYEQRMIDRIIPDFWMAEPFSERALKQRKICIERVEHRIGWQEKVTGILARYGIRAG